jgi:septal ring factor EnvC (AmiA/AmiB activator)
MDITNMVFVTGMVLGSLIIVSVCWVWVRKQVLGAGGGALSFFGVMLVGLSVWSSARVEVTPEGFRAEFERLQKEVNQVAVRSQKISDDVLVMSETSKEITREVKAVADNIDINRAQFLQLTNALKQKRTLNVDQINAINKPVADAPKINRRVLDSAILKFERR